METLYDEHGNALHVGECGIPSETTQVSLSSLALTGLPLGQLVGVAGGLLILGLMALTFGVVTTARVGRIR